MLLASALGLAGAYGIYTAFAVISIWFVFKYVHETKGKELEQMQG
jgi:SP family sugar:H+ symporter-like MFS transporter